MGFYPKIAKQVTNLADGIEKLTTSVASNFLRGGALLFAAFIAAYFVNPIFCLILTVWFILFATASLLMSRKLILLSDSQASAESVVVGELVDTLSNQSNVRIFSRRSYENLRLLPFLSQQKVTYKDTYIYALIMHSVQGGLIAVMMAFSTYYLVYLYGKGLITIGDFALILGLSM